MGRGIQPIDKYTIVKCCADELAEEEEDTDREHMRVWGNHKHNMVVLREEMGHFVLSRTPSDNIFDHNELIVVGRIRNIETLKLSTFIRKIMIVLSLLKSSF